MKLSHNPQIPSDFEAVSKVYSLYGKRVKSNYPMPLPEVKGSQYDVSITFKGLVAKSDDIPSERDSRVWRKEKSGHLLRFTYSKGYMIEFTFSEDGSQISFIQSWPEWRDTLFILMNAVMAASITLQGGVALHASSLVWNNASALIMGNSGAGKSTLSAALALDGLSVHSDDIAVIEPVSGELPEVMPGYSRIKVEPAGLKTLGVSEIPLLPIIKEPVDGNKNDDSSQKQNREMWLNAGHFSGGFYSDKAALNSIIILNERKNTITTPLIERLRPVNAALALTEHIYGRDWLNLPSAKTLHLSARLAETVPVFSVHMPDNLGLLKQSADLIRKKIIESAGME